MFLWEEGDRTNGKRKEEEENDVRVWEIVQELRTEGMCEEKACLPVSVFVSVICLQRPRQMEIVTARINTMPDPSVYTGMDVLIQHMFCVSTNT